MNFKMKKIATAVAAGLGASIVGMNVSHSQDELLFPYLVNSATVTSIVSVVNIELGNVTNASHLHYTYFAKAGANAVNPAAACEEVNFFRPTSPNDIQTFDAGGKFSLDNNNVLFNDPSINNNYITGPRSGIYGGLSLFASPSRAFLIVDNKGGSPGVTGGTGSLYGEAFILDFGTGAAWGYRAYNSLAAEALIADGLTPLASVDTFSNQFETEGEVLKGLTPVQLLPNGNDSIYPDGGFTVRFFVTPIAPSIDANIDGRLLAAELGNQRNGNIAATVGLDIPGSDGTVVFDRDENPISGPSSVPVRCVAGIDVDPDLLSAAVLNLLDGAGGWSYFSSDIAGVTPTTTSTNEVVAFRLDFNRDSEFDGTNNPAGSDLGSGTFNTAVWLRNGTDRNPLYEQQVPLYNYDTPTSAGAPSWPAPGIPSPYHQQ